jgi:hypothetical protein
VEQEGKGGRIGYKLSEKILEVEIKSSAALERVGNITCHIKHKGRIWCSDCATGWKAGIRFSA